MGTTAFATAYTVQPVVQTGTGFFQVPTLTMTALPMGAVATSAGDVFAQAPHAGDFSFVPPDVRARGFVGQLWRELAVSSPNMPFVQAAMARTGDQSSGARLFVGSDFMIGGGAEYQPMSAADGDPPVAGTGPAEENAGSTPTLSIDEIIERARSEIAAFRVLRDIASSNIGARQALRDLDPTYWLEEARGHTGPYDCPARDEVLGELITYRWRNIKALRGLLELARDDVDALDTIPQNLRDLRPEYNPPEFSGLIASWDPFKTTERARRDARFVFLVGRFAGEGQNPRAREMLQAFDIGSYPQDERSLYMLAKLGNLSAQQKLISSAVEDGNGSAIEWLMRLDGDRQRDDGNRQIYEILHNLNIAQLAAKAGAGSRHVESSKELRILAALSIYYHNEASRQAAISIEPEIFNIIARTGVRIIP